MNARFLLCGALWIVSAGAQDAVPMLSFPVECDIGKTCMVQNYFDHDRGAGAKDYRCGFLTYDGHDGTDFRLPNLAAMEKGFRVLAAAGGKVRAIRNSMDDVSLRNTAKEAIKGREAGNSVRIDHGNGWETQYSHMRKGSVLVKPGDVVERGQPLGLVGLSGWTEFPHLHLTVRYNGKTIDPFVGPGEHEQCGPGASALWDAKARTTLRYVPSGMLDSGFAGAVPTFEQIKAGSAPDANATAPALVFWVNTYGMQAGDDEHIRIVAPDGRLLSEARRKVAANKAEWFAYTGKKRTTESWPAGAYRGEYTVTRGNRDRPHEVLSVSREVRISR